MDAEMLLLPPTPEEIRDVACRISGRGRVADARPPHVARLQVGAAARRRPPLVQNAIRRGQLRAVDTRDAHQPRRQDGCAAARGRREGQ
jgi:hypothetical protein